MDMRVIRSTPTATAATASPSPRDRDGGSDRASLGRLLRILADPHSRVHHMETALASHDRTPETDQWASLSLSDHKRISQLQLMLHTIDAALQGASSSPPNADTNLLHALTHALIQQSVDECLTTKENACLWSKQSHKRLLLLRWMLERHHHHEASNDGCHRHQRDGAVVVVLVRAMADTTDKKQQLAACLVATDIVQKLSSRRHNLVALLAPLQALLHQGTVTTTHGPRPSTLGQAAMDALLVVSASEAARWLDNSHVSPDIDPRNKVESLLASIEAALSTLRQWHDGSVSRRSSTLVAVADQLLAYAHLCQSFQQPRDSSSSTDLLDCDGYRSLYERLCWHWVSCSRWLASRSEPILLAVTKRARTGAPSPSLLTFEIDRFVVLASNMDHPPSVDLLAARLRRVYLLWGLQRGKSIGSGAVSTDAPSATVGDTAVLPSSTVSVGKLLLALADTLAVTALASPMESSVRTLVLRAIQTISLEGTVTPAARATYFQIIIHRLTVQLGKATDMIGDRGGDQRIRVPVDVLQWMATFALHKQQTSVVLARNSGFMTHSLFMETQYADIATLLHLDIIKTMLGMLPTNNHDDDISLFKHWRRTLVAWVLHAIQYHPSHQVRYHAVSMLALLDHEDCIHSILKWLSDSTKEQSVSDIIALLFAISESESRCSDERSARCERIATALINTLCRGSVGGSIHTDTNMSSLAPHDLDHLAGKIETAETVEAIHTRFQTISLSPTGWCRRTTSAMVQGAFLCAVVSRLFCDPRDAILLTWLRELTALQWIEAAFPRVLKAVVDHLQRLDRLTDSLLEDDSRQSTSVVEFLLFDRLAPHLVLRVIPRDFFRNPSRHANYPDTLIPLLAQLADMLWNEAVDPLEFKEVKMLAVELLAKWPVVDVMLPRVLSQLATFVEEQQGQRRGDLIPCGFVMAKLMMYYLNRVCSDSDDAAAVTRFITSKRDQEPLDCVVVDMLDILLNVLRIPCHVEGGSAAHVKQLSVQSPLADLQMGTIESLALLVRNTPVEPRSILMHTLLDVILMSNDFRDLHDPAHAPSIQVQDQPIAAWRTIVNRKLRDQISTWQVEAEHQSDAANQLRVCCCNVFLSALAKMEPSDLASFRDDVLCMRLLPSLAPLHPKSMPPASVMAGCLQIIFSFVAHAVSTPVLSTQDGNVSATVLSCFQVATNAIHHSIVDDQVAMNALKLVAVVASKLPWFWTSLSNEIRAHTTRAVQALRDASTRDASVRNLAHALLSTL